MSKGSSAGSLSRFAARLAGLSALLVLAAAPARAEEPERFNEFEFTPFVGFQGGGEFKDPTDNSDRDLDSDTSFGLIADVAADSWRHYELLYTQQSTTVQGAVPIDMDVQYLQIGGIVSYQDAKRAIPYFGMTFGAAQLSPDGAGLDDETKFAFTVGAGLRIPITEHIGVRFDARAFVTLLDTEGDIFCVSAQGLTCRISAKSDTFVQYHAALGVVIGF
jgi:Outer membrane protein beta-barrel domain